MSTQNGWILDSVDPQTRGWEEFYRNRWQHDRVVRSTHGVNCTGSCSWNVHVKDGIVTWEMQALDYPTLDRDLPQYEPRGCQRGISYSWYLYSPLRVKYPYMRGAMLDLWRKARSKHDDPVQAWRSMVSDPAQRKRWQRARGKGGLRRVDWDTCLELIAASCVKTIQDEGPDRITGFSPIPAMSMVSYASGSRFLQLIGGVNLSFYDWYCDLPNASPEIWGEQTDVNESADWFNAKFLAVVGSNLNMTRTPDCHFAAEARHNGTKMVVFSPDFNQVAKYADEWVAIHAGQDGAWWMAVNHVLLSEFHHRDRSEFFLDYVRTYSDSPFLIVLDETEGAARKPGRMLHAGRLARYADEENGEWKYVVYDRRSGAPRMPQGSVGHRWGEAQGKWNLMPVDGKDGTDLTPALTLLDDTEERVRVTVDDFGEGRVIEREVPALRVELADGSSVLVATVYDLLMAQYGVDRGLGGDYPTDYDDASLPFTPAWQERYTGIDRKTLLRFARQWGSTAEKTGGKCTVVIGAGVNHWYHANLMYRAAVHALILCGCVGTNGGGMAHYVGQEKLAPGESWASIAMAKDWMPAPRLQNGPSWHYVHSDQWRYEKSSRDYHTVPADVTPGGFADVHAIDANVRAVKQGWLPFYPSFNENPMDVVREAREQGLTDDKAVVEHVVERITSGDLPFAIEDPDAPESWPRVWFIWRGNALMASAKGHEYFLDHYLGTHTNKVSEDRAQGSVKEVKWWEDAPHGKMDLVVDLNFRMDTSALYSDIVLPAATWYEKDDLNSTDMHSFIHPLAAAVPPCWESKSDWDIFKCIAQKFSELAAKHFPEPVEDLVVAPIGHDSPGEIAQPDLLEWAKGECEAIPGKTMPKLVVVRRDLKHTYDRFCSYGPKARENGLGAHGTHYAIDDEYDELVRTRPTRTWGGSTYPSLADARDTANVILALATVTNGKLAHRSYENMEEKVGLPLKDLAAGNKNVRVQFTDLQAQPRRLLNSPMWSGLTNDGRAYAPFTYNRERMVPWRTLTGRQHLYLDHPLYLEFGEHLPTYKPKPLPTAFADFDKSEPVGPTIELNYLTPHGKWHIHSTYGDNQRMTTLSRGGGPLWMSEEDAATLGIDDNDWVEVHNDHGVVVTRAIVSARIPKGISLQYHSPERTYDVPKSPLRGNKRAGGHNSLTRTRLKVNLMAGGYGQFTYHFNYWGPTGCNRDTHVYVRRLDRVRW